MNKLNAVYKKTKHGYIGWIEEIPGVNTQGRTLMELKENLREAFSLIINANRSLARSLRGTAKRIVLEV